MTPGQNRALKELKSLESIGSDNFEIIKHYFSKETSNLVAYISIRLGPMETSEGGLELMEREDFILVIPPDFPFECPWIKVAHERFANFPHVIWKTQLCLYQSKEVEWNPSDGLFGFFDRLRFWLGKAAINDMDPMEGPLEPPHHVTDFSQLPFVIRANAPIEAKESWFGLAELKKYSNRIELVGWNDLTGEWPSEKNLALTIILPKPLAMEFPKNGSDFFRELLKQDLDRNKILKYLAIASLFTTDEDPIYLILGMPMRRAVDGSTKIHIAVWITEHSLAKHLRTILPKEGDSDAILNLKQDIADILYSLFEKTTITWCKVIEDREEIIVRRDKDSPLTWISNKKILILGCGALGSWAGEIITRARPQHIDLVDKSDVNLGILSRQNYLTEDFCVNKSEALAKRLNSIYGPDMVTINSNVSEAHKFIIEDITRFNSYDLVVDCTASEIFQMKVERDWNLFNGNTPNIISIVIDAKAERCLSTNINRKSTGGIWDAYMQLKRKICDQGDRDDIISSFYSDKNIEGLFQPEPGCSDPTFSGSTADILALVSMALNRAVSNIVTSAVPSGIALSVHSLNGSSGKIDFFDLSGIREIMVDKYRIRMSNNIEREARGWVEQNKRIRSPKHETGGLLWGFWDDAINIIWLFDISGPPPDSLHKPGFFLCGIEGTLAEHERRLNLSHESCGFIGLWHTHPDMSSQQSTIDMESMTKLVSSFGHNQKRVLMLIFGKSKGQSTANFYIYESKSTSKNIDLVSVGEQRIILNSKVT